jgi:hypothetical protein
VADTDLASLRVIYNATLPMAYLGDSKALRRGQRWSSQSAIRWASNRPLLPASSRRSGARCAPAVGRLIDDVIQTAAALC